MRGPFGLRVLSFLGGLLMLFSGFFGIFIGLFTLELWRMFMNIFVCLVAVGLPAI